MLARVLEGRRVAVVHEWFGATGGSEKVFLKIADLVPHADRFALWKDDDATYSGPALRQSWLARTPLRHNKALALPLMPVAWRTLLRKSAYDVVLSSSHAFAHTVRAGGRGDTRYLSYIHSPARYLWSPDFDARGSSKLLALPRKVLQRVDVRLSGHVHSYAANSQEVRRRILKFWERDAWVINPPVDIDYYSDAPPQDRVQNRDYLLGVGRWIPYKNFDFIIEVANRARMPLVIAGSGPEEANLRKLAMRSTTPVVFEASPSDERLRRLYWGARALLFPVHEDFGMIPVEAQACRTPVIGLRRGGLCETVVDGATGFLLDGMDPAHYAEAVRRVGELDAAFTQANVKHFSPESFVSRVAQWIGQEVGTR